MERAAAVRCGGRADGEGGWTARVGGMSVWAGSTLGWALGGYAPWGGGHADGVRGSAMGGLETRWWCWGVLRA